MPAFPIKNQDSTVVEQGVLAKSFLARFRGLMGKKTIPSDEAIVFLNCNSVHTFFMRMPIDVVMVSKKGLVIKIFESVKPWRLLLPVWAAAHTIEMKAGLAQEKGLEQGMHLSYGDIF